MTTLTMPNSVGRIDAPAASASLFASRSRWSIRSLTGRPEIVLALIAALSCATEPAIELMSATVAPSSPWTSVWIALSCELSWLKPCASVSARCKQLHAGRGLVGVVRDVVERRPRSRRAAVPRPVSVGSLNSCWIAVHRARRLVEARRRTVFERGADLHELVAEAGDGRRRARRRPRPRTSSRSRERPGRRC